MNSAGHHATARADINEVVLIHRVSVKQSDVFR